MKIGFSVIIRLEISFSGKKKPIFTSSSSRCFVVAVLLTSSHLVSRSMLFCLLVLRAQDEALDARQRRLGIGHLMEKGNLDYNIDGWNERKELMCTDFRWWI